MLRNLLLAGLVMVGALVVWPGQPSGRLVRVYGDLATADRVAVIVPGADTTVATFDDGTKRPGGAARALLAEAARLSPLERLAVVAWLGYDSPPTLSLGVLTSDAAAKGAHALRRTITELHARTPAPIALLCHSYGSVLCAKAVPGLPVTDLAVFGSPGLDAPSAAALTQPTHNPETARAAATAPTADTTLGMKDGHVAQDATGLQNTHGKTSAQDDQDTADSRDVQKTTGPVGARHPTDAHDPTDRHDPTDDHDRTDAQYARGARDYWPATGMQGTADSPNAGRTADSPATPGTPSPPDTDGKPSPRDTGGRPGPQEALSTADSPDTPDTPGMPGSPDTRGAEDSPDTRSTTSSPDTRDTANWPDTSDTSSPPDARGTADLLDTRRAAGVEGVQGGATGAAVVTLRVWAGLGENDWVRFVPKVKLGPVGFGGDPMNPSFGARVFAVGAGGHSDYFTPGTPSLRNLALIALGHDGEVTS
ncbi:alpha/beta hydrolase [Nonomuraea angiospora]|uniref:alpha/beta hydrolase n=1 Tax=Nonomuraea angiospora TaxID=46172 RepID=UPI00343B3166